LGDGDVTWFLGTYPNISIRHAEMDLPSPSSSDGGDDIEYGESQYGE
jgi:hypothetical protein